MDQSVGIPGVAPTSKRAQAVYRHYGPAFRDIPQVDPLGASLEERALPSGYVALASDDSALNAFAQVAALRMDAQCAMVSLIDDEYQHVLAEATVSMSLRRSSPLNESEHLWLGSVSLPRTWGVCEQVLGLEPSFLHERHSGTVIINDLADIAKYASRTYVTSPPYTRFYAGVALVSPSGHIVGAVSIYDNKPRPGLSDADVLYLKDLSTTVSEYLEIYSIKEGYRHGEQLTRGLISFTEGAASLQSLEQKGLEGHVPPARPQHRAETPADVEPFPQTTEGTTSSSSVPTVWSGLDRQPSRRSLSSALSTEAARYRSMTAMQESILPANSKNMFSRAANIIRSSRDLDGVLILDASLATIGQSNASEDLNAASDTEWERSAEWRYSSEGEGPLSDSPNNSGGKVCQVLGFSTREGSSVAGNVSGLSVPCEIDFRRMLHQYPAGKVIYFDALGEAYSSTESDSACSSTADAIRGNQDRQRRSPVAGQRHAEGTLKSLLAICPNVRSLAFIPFWDYERSRWFAGCLCWTEDPLRPLNAQVDLVYFKVFGHSIMNELSRLDSLASSAEKATFAASVSHELRSPLHGILGTLQFLQDTRLDAFQVSMLNSMNACGRTLLDTVNHLLDFAKASESKRTVSTKVLRDEKTIRLTSRPRKALFSTSSSAKTTAIDLAAITEESVEAMFSGPSFQVTSGAEEENITSPAGLSAGGAPSGRAPVERKSRFIVLDISRQDNWDFYVPIGSWRAIVMNIFGNALKYAPFGFIRVSLRVHKNSNGANALPRVVLSISDSGPGMSQEFLANRLFQAFTQENPHAPGTGLGMSIVRQVIEKIGGKVEVASDNTGTRFTVKLALSRSGNPPTLPSEMLAPMQRLEGRGICVLQQPQSDPLPDPELEAIAKHRQCFVDALIGTLRNHVRLHVIETTEWEGHGADIVICPEPSFEYLSTVRARRAKDGKAPVTIFIAMDALEAATLRSDARIASKESVVEIMTQPCGPTKVLSILNHCLNRYESPLENAPRPTLSRHITPISGVMRLEESTLLEQPIAPVPNEETTTSDPPISTPSPIKHPSPEASQSALTEPSSSLPLHKKPSETSILITDDNPINRKLLATFLKKHQVNYSEAENGLESLTAYKTNPLKFDIILMDISMPVMDGMTATRAIREHEEKNHIRRTSVIALTGLASASAKLEAWRSGVDQFMTKPVNFMALKARLWVDEEI